MTNRYEVGYGKPPQHTRFQKGRSGNPKGRPRKAAPNSFNILGKLLSQKKTIYEDGNPVRVSLYELFFRKLLADGLAGKSQSLKLLYQLIDRHEQVREKQGDLRDPRVIANEILQKIIDDVQEQPKGLPVLKERGDGNS